MLTADYLADGFAFRLNTGRATAHPAAALPPGQGAIRPRTPIHMLELACVPEAVTTSVRV